MLSGVKRTRNQADSAEDGDRRLRQRRAEPTAPATTAASSLSTCWTLFSRVTQALLPNLQGNEAAAAADAQLDMVVEGDETDPVEDADIHDASETAIAAPEDAAQMDIVEEDETDTVQDAAIHGASETTAAAAVPRSWASIIKKLLNHLVVQKVFFSMTSCTVLLLANQVSNPALRAALVAGDWVFVLVELIISLRRRPRSSQ